MIIYLNSIENESQKSEFEKLYFEYREFMKNTAIGILKSENLAEDAVHDAFLKIIEQINAGALKTEISNSTKSFIYIVTRNICFNMQKKERRFVELDKNLCDNTTIDQNIIAKDILDCLRNMPDIYCDTLELYVYYDMTTKEIAKILNIKETTVRKRLERARQMLKSLLEIGGEQVV